MIFRDRQDAGEQLAARLSFLRGNPDLIVLGIPRGGMVVAAQIARILNAPLDVFVAHKIGAPFNPELAVGALAGSGEVLYDEELINALRSTPAELSHSMESQRVEVARQLAMFRQSLPPLDVKGKKVVLVDDGVATGSTVLVALRALRKQAPTQLLLAIPVGPPETLARLACECDRVVVINAPESFAAVGLYYSNFHQTTDQEVIALLGSARRSERTGSRGT
jgi:putative phosphoribosyl transferase